MEVTTTAHPNIALVKYWGKRDERLNLPVAGSISMTLSPMLTRTRLDFVDASSDSVTLNGRLLTEAETGPYTRFLDLFRARARTSLRARVESHNDFPTAAGLASSASGFAALALAASEALELRLSPQVISELARQGSGSACRSIHGGFVEWRRGELPDGRDSIAVPLAPASHWPLCVVIAVVNAGPKALSSREGMRRTAATSPYFRGWIELVEQQLEPVRQAIATRDLAALGPQAERSCLAMFGSMLAADPPVVYWQPATLAAMQTVRTLRQSGVETWFTADAGPNVKAICLEEDAARLEAEFRAIPGISGVIRCGMGGPARRIE